MNESGFIPISVIGEEIFKDFGKEQQKAKIKDNILKRYGIEKVDEELNGDTITFKDPDTGNILEADMEEIYNELGDDFVQKTKNKPNTL